MSSEFLLLLWLTASVAHIWLGVIAYRRSPSASLVVSGAAGFVSLLALFLFLLVFVFGGSSNVAQMAGDSGMSLWRLWFHTFFPLFIGCVAALLASIVALALPPYPPRQWPSFLARLAGAVSLLIACTVLMRFPPDA